jgi:hypothetical protein
MAAVVTEVDMAVGITEVGTSVEDIEAEGFIAHTAVDIMAVITARCTIIRQAAMRPVTPPAPHIQGLIASLGEAPLPIATG